MNFSSPFAIGTEVSVLYFDIEPGSDDLSRLVFIGEDLSVVAEYDVVDLHYIDFGYGSGLRYELLSGTIVSYRQYADPGVLQYEVNDLALEVTEVMQESFSSLDAFLDLFYGAADRVNGSSEDDELFGFRGNDTMFGNAGADRLDGAHGSDVLRGGAVRIAWLVGEGPMTSRAVAGQTGSLVAADKICCAAMAVEIVFSVALDATSCLAEVALMFSSARPGLTPSAVGWALTFSPAAMGKTASRGRWGRRTVWRRWR